MADVKITELTAVAGAASTMLIPVVEDPSGTPVTKKMTVSQLFRLDSGVITSSAPLIDMAQTWNSGGVTFTALKVNIAATASAAASMLIDLQVGGTSKFKVTQAGDATLTGGLTVGTTALFGDGAGALTAGVPGIAFTGASQVGFRRVSTTGAVFTASGADIWFSSASALQMRSNGIFGFSATTDPAGATDVNLYRDAANTLAQRNGTNAQIFKPYNTYTDASNYERGYVGWVSNKFWFSMEKAGTGSNRAMGIGGSNVASIDFSVAGSSAAWNINASGHLVTGTDNTYDIGASGATRPRTVYVGTDVTAAGVGRFVGGLNINSAAILTAPSTGILLLRDNAGTDWARIQLGGTTSSFPAIKRDAAGIKFVVADDSASADIECLSLKTGAPNGGTAAKWKGGVLVTAAVTPDTTRYIELDVAGTLYKVIVST